MAPGKDPLRIVFMGTPAFSAQILLEVLSWPGGLVAGVFTQPDRPAGRGRRTRPSEVKQLALAKGLPIFQPESLRNPEQPALIASLRPDVLVVAAYGLILPQTVLDIPPLGCVNVHTSLLPRWRGAAPIQRALLAGDDMTGVTIMRMNAGMDTGDILLQRSIHIKSDDTASSLHDALTVLGASALLTCLDSLTEGTLKPQPQNHDQATYAPKIAKEEGCIDWTHTARDVHNRVRAMHPWPGAFFFWSHGEGAPILRIALSPGAVGPLFHDSPWPSPKPGDILGILDNALAIACQDRVYLIPSVHPEAKKAMDACSFYNGYMKNSPSGAAACPAP